RPLLTTQTLPSMVPFSTCVTDDEEYSPEMGVYVIPSVMSAQAHWYPSSPASNGEASSSVERRLVFEALDRQIQLGPFTRYSELINEAQGATLNGGIPRAAGLTPSSAGEVMLDGALRFILWEKGYTPELAGKLFADE